MKNTKKYDLEYFQKMGRRGGLSTLKKHGKKHFKKIRNNRTGDNSSPANPNANVSDF